MLPSTVRITNTKYFLLQFKNFEIIPFSHKRKGGTFTKQFNTKKTPRTIDQQNSIEKSGNGYHVTPTIKK